MTPDKRLDQIEPILADVAHKTDRLIESNGQILEIATRADNNAAIAARGVADLTIKVNLLIEGQVELNQKTDQLTTGQDKLNQKTDQLAISQDKLNQKTDQLAIGQDKLNQKTDQLTVGQEALRQEIQEINQKFTHFEQTQQQILTLLLDRLK